jgi:lysozyme family protein
MKTAVFRNALAHTLKEEGGYANHPNDPGGATMRGVTQGTYDTWRKRWGKPVAPVRGIADSELEEIYYRGYWLDGRCNLLESDALLPGLAVVHFDSCVNAGVTQAGKLLQRAVGVAADGRVGPTTITAARAAGRGAIPALVNQRVRFYQDLARSRPALAVFLRGWLLRVNRIGAAAGVSAAASVAARPVAADPAPPAAVAPSRPVVVGVATRAPVPPAIRPGWYKLGGLGLALYALARGVGIIS